MFIMIYLGYLGPPRERLALAIVSNCVVHPGVNVTAVQCDLDFRRTLNQI